MFYITNPKSAAPTFKKTIDYGGVQEQSLSACL